MSFEIKSFSEIIVLSDAENEIETSVKSVSQIDSKATAEIEFSEVDKYSVIFADYENGKLNLLDCVEKTVDETGVVTVSSAKDITGGTGDKVMVWKSI